MTTAQLLQVWADALAMGQSFFYFLFVVALGTACVRLVAKMLKGARS